MELEFDKEIDAILRGSRLDDRVSDGGHADADAAALFAENLMPATVRNEYLRHFAECARCRKLLSGIVAFSAEESVEPVAIAAPAISEKIPWYSRLFVMPNLAYVMGGLILVFGGFFALQVLKSTGSLTGSGAVDVSHVSEQEPAASGPNLGSEPQSAYSNANAAISSTASSNTAANAVANHSVSTLDSNVAVGAGTAGNRADVSTEDREKEEDKKVQIDGLTAGKPVEAVPPPAVSQPVAKEKPADDRLADTATAAAPRNEPDTKTDAAKGRASTEVQAMKDEKRPGGPSKSAGPSRDLQRQFPNTLNQRNLAAATRRVGGKTFEYNDRVWYDTSYRGGQTINVRRGTEEFNKLGAALRTIANSISGTIVVVWKDKSYRID